MLAKPKLVEAAEAKKAKGREKELTLAESLATRVPITKYAEEEIRVFPQDYIK